MNINTRMKHSGKKNSFRSSLGRYVLEREEGNEIRTRTEDHVPLQRNVVEIAHARTGYARSLRYTEYPI